MVKIIKVNCDKWKKVIGITLWIGATIGLGIGMYFLANNSLLENGNSCFFENVVNWNGITPHVKVCYYDNGFGIIFLWTITLLSNGGNYLSIWITLNNKYKFLKFKCVSKKETVEFKLNDGMSNAEYFKAKEGNNE